MDLIKQEFFNRDTLIVAEELIGVELVVGEKRAIINETEAYIGQGDPACHAARGKTKRNEVMFGPPGGIYVYLIYGMYFCLNFVTEKEGFPAAVLIRGLVPKGSLKIDKQLNGPGKICREFIINKSFNGLSLEKTNKMMLFNSNIKVKNIQKTPRIGISKAKDLPWRFLGDF